MEADGLQSIINIIALIFGAGGIVGGLVMLLTLKPTKRKIAAEGNATENKSFLDLVDRMEVRLDKQDQEITKLQKQVEQLIEKVSLLEEKNRMKDAHIRTLTDRLRYVIRLLKELLAEMESLNMIPEIHLPSWIEEYAECEDEE